MEVVFEEMKPEHGKGIIDIFNHYIVNSFSAFPEKKVPYTFFDQFMQMTENYPAFTIMHQKRIVGFCFLHAYQLWPTFSECGRFEGIIMKKGKRHDLVWMQRTVDQ